jgi:hypothetical protein
MKYVIIKNPIIQELEEAVIFPDSLTHRCFKLFNPISAGFVTIECNDVHVYGYSESLQLRPRPQDEEIIKRAIDTKQKIFIEDEINPEGKNGID